MTTRHDVIVAGLGAAGSSALRQLAGRGVKALGIDRFAPPHDHGSSHGDTRITRLALGEGGHYLQFAKRSHEIWRELESATGRTLLRQVGGLVFGSTVTRSASHGAEDFLGNTIEVARQNGIAHEVLDAASMRDRFPQFVFRDDARGCFEHSAGFLHPEECIAAQLEVARRLGAEVRKEERVLEWRPSATGVRVATDRGSYEAERLILSAGAWMPALVKELEARARVFRQVLFWFEAGGPREIFAPERMPVYIRVPDEGAEMFYGFPAINGPGGGMKMAGEQFERTCLPDEMDRDVSESEVDAMYALASPHLRMSSRCVRAVACKYTVTPDFGFIIDHLPASDRVWLASPCSGHGFKHSAAVGEALAELAIEGRTQFEIAPFRLARFGA